VVLFRLVCLMTVVSVRRFGGSLPSDMNFILMWAKTQEQKPLFKGFHSYFVVHK
jgi:hypothetical protein